MNWQLQIPPDFLSKYVVQHPFTRNEKNSGRQIVYMESYWYIFRHALYRSLDFKHFPVLFDGLIDLINVDSNAIQHEATN